MKKSIIVIAGLLCIIGVAVFVFSSGDSDKKPKTVVLKLQVMTEERPDMDPDEILEETAHIINNRLENSGLEDFKIDFCDNSIINIHIPKEEYESQEDMPGRIRQLIHGTATLEFWPTFFNTDIYPQMIQLADETNNLTSVFSFQTDLSACLGHAHYKDTAFINNILRSDKAELLLDKNLRPLWSAKPMYGTDDIFELIAINDNGLGAPVDGNAIKIARAEPSEYGNAMVSIEMSDKGARAWARLTEENIGKQLAIVIDGLVYSYPYVNQRIDGGKSTISGNFTVKEAKDLATVLHCGALPVSVKILEISDCAAERPRNEMQRRNHDRNSVKDLSGSLP